MRRLRFNVCAVWRFDPATLCAAMRAEMDRPSVMRSPDNHTSRRALSRIAEALRVPVVTLYDDRMAPIDLAQASELLHLWSSLTSDRARETVLASVRAASGIRSK